jgi:hypothetical protein
MRSWLGPLPGNGNRRFPNGEDMAKTNAAERYRGALIARVDEVRRLRGIILDGREAAR